MSPNGEAPVTSETARSATERDQAVGHRIRLARSLIGISQTDLAARIGVSFQQVQKYEKGANRVAAQRLREIANAVGQPLDWFFGDADDARSASPTQLDNRTLETLASSEGVLLVTTFARIQSPELRRRVVALVVSVADALDVDG